MPQGCKKGRHGSVLALALCAKGHGLLGRPHCTRGTTGAGSPSIVRRGQAPLLFSWAVVEEVQNGMVGLVEECKLLAGNARVVHRPVGCEQFSERRVRPFRWQLSWRLALAES